MNGQTYTHTVFMTSKEGIGNKFTLHQIINNHEGCNFIYLHW